MGSLKASRQDRPVSCRLGLSVACQHDSPPMPQGNSKCTGSLLAPCSVAKEWSSITSAPNPQFD
eukprot:6459626-Amphidinium_carterae.1